MADKSQEKRYSYEYVPRLNHKEPGHFRIKDWNNNRVATCYVELNAILVTDALNIAYSLGQDKGAKHDHS